MLLKNSTRSGTGRAVLQRRVRESIIKRPLGPEAHLMKPPNPHLWTRYLGARALSHKSAVNAGPSETVSQPEMNFGGGTKRSKSGRSRAAAALVLAAGVSPRSSGKIMEPRSRGPHYAPPLRVMGWRSGGTGCETVSSGPRFRVPYISLSPLRFVTSAAKAVFYSGWLTRR